MMSSPGALITSPLLQEESSGAEGERGWWVVKEEAVMDNKEEAKNQILFALPMILTNTCFYFITLVSVMFVGHLGDLPLAAANLANSWASVSGLSFMVGLSGALETLCGQGYGAKLYRMMGVYLQTACIISFLSSVIISAVWWFSEHILVLLQQDPEIAKLSGLYLKFFIPGLYAYGFLQNLLRFMQTQRVVLPLVMSSIVPLTIQVGLTYVLVRFTSLGFAGAPLAASISLWLSFLMLAGYVLFSGKFNNTWEGFSSESFSYFFVTMRLALPSAAMVCMEYWAFELLVLLAGIMPNSEITTSLIGMCVNTEAIAYMIAYGLNATASTRVSNELGAGRPERAKQAVAVTFVLCILLASATALSLVFGHNVWAGLFSDSAAVISNFGSMAPLLVISFLFDFFQGILSGHQASIHQSKPVARGCGWQHLAVGINLGSFYFIGMPIAAVLAFKFKLYVKGLWIGLICGLASQSSGLLLLSIFRKWDRVEISTITEKDNHKAALLT